MTPNMASYDLRDAYYSVPIHNDSFAGKADSSSLIVSCFHVQKKGILERDQNFFAKFLSQMD